MVDSQPYPPAVRGLLAEARLAPLGPGRSNETARAMLAEISAATMFAPARVADPIMAEACLAGLWLYHDCLDESHAISQDLPSVEGSYWHALMHRRELDFGNAKYWFRRVGRHIVFAPLATAAAELACAHADRLQTGPHRLTTQTGWNPFAFVDLCEQAYSSTDKTLERLCRAIQDKEWQLLFDHCFMHALGRN